MELKLSLPGFTARSYAEVEIRPAKAQKWLSELPVLNLAESAQKLFSALNTLNRMELDDQNRLELLELYADPVSKVSTELRKSIIDLPLPLSDRHKIISDRNRQFATEMAYGYKRIVLNANQSGDCKPNGKNAAKLALPLQRAIRYLSEALVRSYQFYATCPPGVWREIHDLYCYAEFLGIADATVNDPLNDTVPHSSIAHVYKQALLVDLSDPFHLPMRMIRKIHRYLDRWASLATLTEAASGDTSACQFLIDQQSDRAARAYSTDIQINQPERYRLLSTVELARVIHAQIGALKEQGSVNPEGLENDFYDDDGQEMLQRLIFSWGLIPKRRYTRSAMRGSDVNVAIGIDSINYWLNGGREFTLSTSLVGPPAKRTQLGMNASDKSGKKNMSLLHTIWELHDESAGGFSIRKTGVKPESTRIGDLVAMKLPEGETWAIGIIRWIKTTGQSDVEIGVQRLAPGATAIVIKTINEESEESDFLPALLLPEIKELRQKQTVVAHKGAFKPKRVFYADTGYSLLKAVPTVLMETSGYFEQFQFESLES